MKKTSIACIAFEGNKVFIAHRNPTGQMGNRWEFPGGKVEEGETDEQSIIREFQEEFGVTVTVNKKIASPIFGIPIKSIALKIAFMICPSNQATCLITGKFPQLNTILVISFLSA